MKRFHAWLRVISPAGRLVGTSWIVTCLLIGGCLLIAVFDRTTWGVKLPEYTKLAQRTGVAMACLGSLVYGGTRLFYFHPWISPNYRRWLRSTPWALPRRLPLGPVEFCVQDAFWMMMISAPAMPGSSPWFVLVACFLTIAAYSLTLSFYLLRLGPYWAAYGIYFTACAVGWYVHWVGHYFFLPWQCGVPGAEPLGLDSAPICIGLLGFTAAFGWISQIGVRQQLRRLPWDIEHHPARDPGELQRDQKTGSYRLGWPLMAMRPDVDVSSRTSRLEIIVQSVVISIFLCLLIAIGSDLASGDRIDLARGLREWQVRFQNVLVVWAQWGLALPGAYILIHLLLEQVPLYRPPISFGARAATRRWLVPGYDRIARKHVLALIPILMGVLFARAMPAYALHGTFVAVLWALLVFRFAGPSPEAWHLLGQYRLVRGVGNVRGLSRRFPGPEPRREHFWS